MEQSETEVQIEQQEQLQTMDKTALLKELATNGYNIGFGAKKHFATYEIVSKLPGIISIVGLLIGVGQLAYPDYNFSTEISTILIMASIIGLTINSYNSEKELYNEAGIKLTTLYNELRILYESVKGSSENNFTKEVKEMKSILGEYYATSRSQQIIGADWYAHYKFFFQMQHEWIHEQKNFKFWRDMVPKSFIAFLIYAPIIVAVWIYIFVIGG